MTALGFSTVVFIIAFFPGPRFEVSLNRSLTPIDGDPLRDARPSGGDRPAGSRGVHRLIGWAESGDRQSIRPANRLGKTAMKQTYEGACHCGKVRFEVTADIDHVRVCDCSNCRARGALIHRVPEEAVDILTPLSELTLYQWGSYTAKDYFCPVCGILPFRRTSMPTQAGIRYRVGSVRRLGGQYPLPPGFRYFRCTAEANLPGGRRGRRYPPR